MNDSEIKNHRNRCRHRKLWCMSICMKCAFLSLTKIQSKKPDLNNIHYVHHVWKWILEHYFPLNEWNMSVNPLIHCFSFLNISCSQAPFMIWNSLRGGVGRWLKISIIFVKKALHNFKTDEPTSWNLICHVYKYCVCFFQGHLIIPKEGIENARVDLGGSK